MRRPAEAPRIQPKRPDQVCWSVGVDGVAEGGAVGESVTVGGVKCHALPWASTGGEREVIEAPPDGAA